MKKIIVLIFLIGFLLALISCKTEDGCVKNQAIDEYTYFGINYEISETHFSQFVGTSLEVNDEIIRWNCNSFVAERVGIEVEFGVELSTYDSITLYSNGIPWIGLKRK